ncbi:MAG: 7-cyano-7-deazaguanine synthase QueC, partial [Pseudobdellovibrionaceae bacterium]
SKLDEIVLALTFDYGQRAASKEIERAQALCEKLNIDHQVISLPWFSQFQSSSLLNKNMKVPIGAQIQMDDIQASKDSAKSVWVPNRNGIFLNIAAGFAEALGAQYVIPGFNIEEAQTFPDNSEAFMKALDHSFSFSTANHIQVKCYSHTMNKTGIVSEGKKLGMDFTQLWPCYHNNDHWCGECESCQRFKRALDQNSIEFKCGV